MHLYLMKKAHPFIQNLCLENQITDRVQVICIVFCSFRISNVQFGWARLGSVKLD